MMMMKKTTKKGMRMMRKRSAYFYTFFNDLAAHRACITLQRASQLAETKSVRQTNTKQNDQFNTTWQTLRSEYMYIL